MAAAQKPLTAFARVRQILNDAQGDQIPDYQGYRAFWQSLDTFKEARLYGQWMIAPASAEEESQLQAAAAQSPSQGTGQSCCQSTNQKTNSQKNPLAFPGVSANLSGNPSSHSNTDPAPAAALNTSNLGLSASGPAVAAVNIEPTWPNAQASCWPSGGSAGGGGASPGRKRSDRSGLIIGLRGQYPFDGSIFQPLLWNAAHAVSTTDIQFIADWIDSGCPLEEITATTSPSTATAQAPSASSGRLEAGRNERQALACGDLAHPVASSSTNQNAGQRKSLHVRKEISSMNAEELARYRAALACMYQYNGYWLDERSFDYWARIHTDSCQHGWEQFLPWHRLYLYFFEQTLQDYDPLITLPYWSWTDYAVPNRDTYQTQQADLGVIPEAYRCWINSESVRRLKATGLYSDEQIAALEILAAKGTTFNSGLRFLKAATVPYTLEKDPSTGQASWTAATRAIYNELRRLNPLWFPNRWPGSVGAPTHYPNAADVEQILAVSTWPDFGGGPEYDHHFGALEEVHNGMHNFAGGVNTFYPPPSSLGIVTPDAQNMENPSFGWMTDNRVTAYDPIFWAHHSNVDRLWARWQELHPNQNPSELDGSLAPWRLTVSDALSIRKLGYEYMRDSFYYPTSQGQPLTRFKGEEVGVRSDVLEQHRKCEVRLHRVRRGNLENCAVRIFMNAPGADEKTNLVNNPNYVGQIQTFHNSCYGGPGHCNLPLEKTRKTDQRGLHHHEPRNFRIDASNTVQTLLNQGAKDLSVHLVVVGLDGQPKDHALYIDGVSLNFLD